MKKHWCVGAIVIGCLGSGSAAWAAETPDIVRLKNGGMVRGTIDEFIPGDHVRITMANGESRTFPAAEVDSAGPSSPAPAASAGTAGHFEVAPTAAPSAPPPPPASAPPPVVATKEGMLPLKLEATGAEQQVMFHVRNGMQTGSFGGVAWTSRGVGSFGGNVQSDSYVQLCSAPCTAELPRGTYKLALTEDDGRPVAADGMVVLNQPSTLSGKYKSFAGLRAAGWFALIGGSVLMVLSPFVAKNDCATLDDQCELYDSTALYGMLGGGAAVALVGAFLALKGDEATISVTPGLSASRLRRQGVADVPHAPTPLALTGKLRF